MAFVYLNADITKAVVGRVVSGPMTVVMPDDAQIVSTQNDALRLTGGFGTFSLAGDLYANQDAFELLSAARVTFAATSDVFGGTFGLRATKDLTLTNFGAINGGIDGLRSLDALTLNNFGTLSGVSARAGANVFNGATGQITGTLNITGLANDVVRVTNAGEIGLGGVQINAVTKVTISNSGTIHGDVTVTQPGNRITEITNTGLIDGDVNLGNGADDFDLRGGTVTGNVIGGRGNDIYRIDSSDVSITEADTALGGRDKIYSSVDYGLDLAANVETLVLVGGRSLRGIGDGDDNTIFGNSGGNRISGLDGDDSLYGGSGGDSLRGGRGNDRLEGGSEEDLIFGAAGSDTLIGGTGDDTLLGGGLHDRIVAGDGNDAINGGFGNDTIIAGRGLDDMTGGSGNDIFRFESASIWEATPQDDDVARPVISDFKQGADAIDLRAIDADGSGTDTAFDFIGTNVPFSGARGELRADTTTSAGRTIVEGDIDGDGLADLNIEMRGTFFLSGSDLFL